MTNKVTVSIDFLPVVVITQLVEQLTDDERRESLDECDRVLASFQGRYSLVLDNRRAGPVPPRQRKLIAEYSERHALRARARCASTAFVHDSVIMRGILTAITWLQKPEVEVRVFSDLPEAIAWSRQQHGLAPLDSPTRASGHR